MLNAASELKRANDDDEDFAEHSDEEESDSDEAEEDDDDDDEEEEDEDEEEAGLKKPKKAATAGKSGIYVPPKIKPVYYDGDEKSADKDKKLLERAKKRAMT